MPFQSFSKNLLKMSTLASYLAAPIVLGSAVIGFAANSAQAMGPGFAGVYDPANWTQDIISNGSVDTTNAPVSVTLIGADNNPPNPGQTDFTIAAAPYTGQVSFDWVYSTLDQDASFDPFGYILNSTFFKLSNDVLGNQSGSSSFGVVIGDTFGFSQRSTDSDFGAAETVIGNFVAPTGPGPGPASVPAPLPLFGVGVSLIWSRRLRKRVASAT
jgi:hypothetical protein